jgi:acetyl-CoA carboxylase biotin carboxyl carrier protein
MAENGLTDLQLKDGDQRIILSRGGAGFSAGGMPMMPAIQMPSMPSSPSATEAAPSSIGASRPADTGAAGAQGLVEIKSPMVGTYYASPTPDAKPFVQVGDRVGPDTDVCIIEAMKVFNNIKAETSGAIEKILAENGQAVEYGQVLFLVRPQ